jgi:hypothetical protein
MDLAARKTIGIIEQEAGIDCDAATRAEVLTMFGMTTTRNLPIHYSELWAGARRPGICRPKAAGSAGHCVWLFAGAA